MRIIPIVLMVIGIFIMLCSGYTAMTTPLYHDTAIVYLTLAMQGLGVFAVIAGLCLLVRD